MSKQSIAKDVGQLLWVGFEGTSIPDALRRQIGSGEVGGVVLFARNLVTNDAGTDLEHLVALNRALHQSAGEEEPKLWICVDQEGGRVQRIKEPATVWPPMLQFSNQRAHLSARQIGRAMGRELAWMGFDVDFAPVLDVHTNSDNPIIGDRAFSCQADTAAEVALDFAEGLADAGIVSCGKHFPGHGDTAIDSHLALPRVEHSRARLDAVELLPFRRAALRELPMIMTAHVVFAAVDDGVPATLSRAVVTGILREEIGYRGIVVSDDLDMRAIADHFGVGDAAIEAVRAGCDAVLLCRDLEHQGQAREALVRGCEKESALRARVADAAERIRVEKKRRSPELVERAMVGCEAHRALAQRLAAAT